MHKCQCGQEFEGDYCPNCGTKWQNEKTCPKCGTKLNWNVRFCNKCGYSFVPQQVTAKPRESKLKTITDWIKSHLKIVIPIAIAVALIIILSTSIPACVKGQTNGTYYKLKPNGEIDQKTYFILKSGKWEDEDGESGTYKKDGENITFYVTFFGETEELTTGTLKDYVLKVEKDTYISEKHKHNYGEWEETEATCTMQGYEMRTCECGINEREITEKLPHTFSDWQADKSSHWKICGTCENKFESDTHDNISNCTVCGYPAVYSLNSDKKGYTLKSRDKNITEFNIPSTYNSLPVTSIGNSAFSGCTSLTNITIPDSVTSIGYYAFYYCSSLTSLTIPDSVTEIGNSAFENCSSLTSIKFEGTMAQWKAIKKSSNWNEDTGNYTVYCTDGEISKADS